MQPSPPRGNPVFNLAPSGRGARVRECLILPRVVESFFVHNSTLRGKHDTTSSNLSIVHHFPLILLDVQP